MSLSWWHGFTGSILVYTVASTYRFSIQKRSQATALRRRSSISIRLTLSCEGTPSAVTGELPLTALLPGAYRASVAVLSLAQRCTSGLAVSRYSTTSVYLSLTVFAFNSSLTLFPLPCDSICIESESRKAKMALSSRGHYIATGHEIIGGKWLLCLKYKDIDRA